MTAPTNVRACYRHPDRVAGIVCQRCDRPICPSCMHQASVGFHCPECTRTGAQQVYQGVDAVRTRPVATQVLIGLNVAVFVLGIVLTGTRGLAERSGTLVVDGGLFGPLVPTEPWRLFTSGFLHAGLLHIGLNMWVLSILGRFLEPALGRARFVALYLCALFWGGLGVVVLDPTALTVGASGAIYGLMGGALLVAREHNIDLMRSGLVATLGINLLLTFAIPGITIGGHLGGLVGGALAGVVLTQGAARLGRQGDALSAVLTVALGLAAAGLAYALMVARFGF